MEILHLLAVICLVSGTTKTCKAVRIDTDYSLCKSTYSYKTEMGFNLTGNWIGTEKSSVA